MAEKKFITCDGNYAAAHVAYMFSVVAATLKKPDTAPKVLEGLAQWVSDQGADDINDLIGAFEC